MTLFHIHSRKKMKKTHKNNYPFLSSIICFCPEFYLPRKDNYQISSGVSLNEFQSLYIVFYLQVHYANINPIVAILSKPYCLLTNPVNMLAMKHERFPIHHGTLAGLSNVQLSSFYDLCKITLILTPKRIFQFALKGAIPSFIPVSPLCFNVFF